VSKYLDQVAKYVVTTSMHSAQWQNTTILRGPAEQEIAKLKKAEGSDIVVTGSVELVQTLHGSGLVDLYRLFVYPAVQGHGRRLFGDTFSTKLELTNSQTFRSGVVLLEYRPIS
jgi:dihydrofolate reductase